MAGSSAPVIRGKGIFTKRRKGSDFTLRNQELCAKVYSEADREMLS
jgi:hypothetical protein